MSQIEDSKSTGGRVLVYDCNKCGHRNRHNWYGAEKHICTECEHKEYFDNSVKHVEVR
jgi:hypothetical protein